MFGPTNSSTNTQTDSSITVPQIYFTNLVLLNIRLSRPPTSFDLFHLLMNIGLQLNLVPAKTLTLDRIKLPCDSSQTRTPTSELSLHILAPALSPVSVVPERSLCSDLIDPHPNRTLVPHATDVLYSYFLPHLHQSYCNYTHYYMTALQLRAKLSITDELLQVQ